MLLSKIGRAVFFQTLVHKCDDLVQCVGLESLLAGDSPNQTVHPLDVLGAAKKRARRRRGLGEALGRLCVLFKRTMSASSAPSAVQSFQTQS